MEEGEKLMMAALPDSSQIRPKPRNGHLKAGSQRRVSAGHAQPRLLDPDILKEVELPVDEKSKGPTRDVDLIYNPPPPPFPPLIFQFLIFERVPKIKKKRQSARISTSGPGPGALHIYRGFTTGAPRDCLKRKVDSTIGEAVLWLKDHDSEESYRLFEEIFVPSPNLGVGKLLDQKDDVYLAQDSRMDQAERYRDEYTSVTTIIAESNSPVSQVGFWVQNPEFRELIERISKAPIGRNLRGNSADFLAGPVNYKSQVTNAASLPLPRAMHKYAQKEETELWGNSCTDPSLWNLSDASLRSSWGNVYPRSLYLRASLSAYIQPSNLFLVKLTHLGGMGPTSRTKLLHDLLEMWNPVIYSSWITLDELILLFQQIQIYADRVVDELA
ncbi:hypothetical protein PSTT_13864, partial [Puccinia striiformis]